MGGGKRCDRGTAGAIGDSCKKYPLLMAKIKMYLDLIKSKCHQSASRTITCLDPFKKYSLHCFLLLTFCYVCLFALFKIFI
jgi:hypothetical protein